MTWITTRSGQTFDYANPSIEAIDIKDIALALSHECRFAGHLPKFYSVAQHSVFVSWLVPAEYALEALMHDAVEAYCKDIPSPLKRLLPDYQAVENNIDGIIRQRFGLPLQATRVVKHADLVALATERRDLGLEDGKDWPMLKDITPSEMLIHPWSSDFASVRFIERFNQLSQ